MNSLPITMHWMYKIDVQCFHLVFYVLLLCILCICSAYLEQSCKVFKLLSPKPFRLELSCFCLCFSLQSTSALTCATIVSACCFKTRLFSGEGRRGIKVGSRWCWILCRVWGSWTGGIRSTPLLTTHRSPDLAPPSVECHKVNHVDISLPVPNVNIFWNRACETLIYVQW